MWPVFCYWISFVSTFLYFKQQVDKYPYIDIFMNNYNIVKINSREWNCWLKGHAIFYDFCWTLPNCYTEKVVPIHTPKVCVSTSLVHAIFILILIYLIDWKMVSNCFNFHVFDYQESLFLIGCLNFFFYEIPSYICFVLPYI